MRIPARQLTEHFKNLQALFFFSPTKDNAAKLFKIKSKSLNKETLFTASRKLFFFSLLFFFFLEEALHTLYFNKDYSLTS